MVEAFRGRDGGLPGRPVLHLALQLPDGAQRRVDQGLGTVADLRTGIDALPAAGERLDGRAGSGAGRCDGGAEQGGGERNGQQGGAEAGVAYGGHGDSSPGRTVGCGSAPVRE
ncbi:hypothetical protein GCM10017687_00140 [Streptomyces echinatus]